MPRLHPLLVLVCSVLYLSNPSSVLAAPAGGGVNPCRDLSPVGVREYNLELTNIEANMTGTPFKDALAVNGQIPAPTLCFREGDEAVINVKNSSDEPTSLHWHGILLPWGMDGVPYLNTPPVKPGETFTYRFKIRHSGTYWYHSHWELQEQRGVYGAFIIEPAQKRIHVDEEIVVVLSDWINEHPNDVIANIKKDGHYYALKKDAVPSITDAISRGEFSDWLGNRKDGMEGMDLADVGYDGFLVNGHTEYQPHTNLSHSKKVRLRIINAGASSYFYINIGNNRMFQVVSADGVDVQPVMVSEVLIGMGETYDLVFMMPHEMGKSFELRATAQDVSGYGSLVLGHGANLEAVPDKPRPSLYRMGHGGHGDMPMPPGDGDDGEMPMPPGDDDDGGIPMPPGDDDHGGHGNHMTMGEHDDHGGGHPPDHGNGGHVKRLEYGMLKSIQPTSFPAGTPDMEFTITFEGDMERYVWTLNGELLSENTYIDIKAGHVIRFVMKNTTMMHHPMHLHGHFFRVLNGQGNHAPLMHTVDVPPMQDRTIEFLANEPGEWFFHCHNLYHMKQGMARVVRYAGFERPEADAETAEGLQKVFNMDSTYYFGGSVSAFSNVTETTVRLNGGRYEFVLQGEIPEYDVDKLEADLRAKMWMNRKLHVFGGVRYEEESVDPIVGLGYQLPYDVDIAGRTTLDGEVVFEVGTHFQITQRLRLDLHGEQGVTHEFETEGGADLMYQLTNEFAVGGNVRYSEEQYGGVSFGVGAMIKF